MDLPTSDLIFGGLSGSSSIVIQLEICHCITLAIEMESQIGLFKWDLSVLKRGYGNSAKKSPFMSNEISKRQNFS